MFCRIGSTVVNVLEISTVIPDGDDFIVTMKNGQQLRCVDRQVAGLYEAMDTLAPLTNAGFADALSNHASVTARATRHAGDATKSGLQSVGSSIMGASGQHTRVC